MSVRTFLLRNRFDVEAVRQFLASRWQAKVADGYPLAVEVHETRGQRTIAQNKFYWSLLGDIAENAWVNERRFDAETWHAFFAGKFVGWHELPGGGRAPISTTTLDVAEFTAYLEKIQAYATTELDIEIAA